MSVNKKALNIELLKFVGFTYTEGGWSYPDGTDVGNRVPFFPGSVDECLKWIVPKLSYCSITKMERAHLGNHWVCEVRLEEKSTIHYGHSLTKDPTLALCLAIKELIK